MEVADIYTYSPIQPNQIRLCRFRQNGDSLAAEFGMFSTDAPLPEYVALSYTWDVSASGPIQNWSIQLGERYLPVLDSLKPFFQALRSRNLTPDETWWWVR